MDVRVLWANGVRPRDLRQPAPVGPARVQADLIGIYRVTRPCEFDTRRGHRHVRRAATLDRRHLDRCRPECSTRSNPSGQASWSPTAITTACTASRSTEPSRRCSSSTDDRPHRARGRRKDDLHGRSRPGSPPATEREDRLVRARIVHGDRGRVRRSPRRRTWSSAAGARCYALSQGFVPLHRPELRGHAGRPRHRSAHAGERERHDDDDRPRHSISRLRSRSSGTPRTWSPSTGRSGRSTASCGPLVQAAELGIARGRRTRGKVSGASAQSGV